jgi:hypothetical protein
MAMKKKGNPETPNSALQPGVGEGSGVIAESREPLFGIRAKFSGNGTGGPRK